MNDNPLLSKMDALLKKHRGGEAAEPAPPPAPTPRPGAWLPVLTDLIERGSPPAALSPQHPLPAAAAAASKPPKATADTNEALAHQLLCELAPRLSEAMEKQVSEELRKNLDQTLASVLSQLDINVRDLVRDAVAEKLKQPRDPAA